MKSGIRIFDKVARVVSVDLPFILGEVQDGDSYSWAILFLDATWDSPLSKTYSTIPEFRQK